jgi:protein-S-isoprenylcysteine O-methyltransferase Ste14
MGNESDTWTNIASALATVTLVLTIIRLFFIDALFGRGLVAVGAQVLALGLMLWARATFGLRSFHATAKPTAGGLVKTGPYGYVRHPIYAAVLLFVWTGVLSHASPQPVALGSLATLATLVRMLSEERLVSQRYPEYAAYAAQTSRLVPYVF